MGNLCCCQGSTLQGVLVSCCCRHHEIFNFKTKDLHFSFALGLANSVVGPVPWLLVHLLLFPVATPLVKFGAPDAHESSGDEFHRSG